MSPVMREMADIIAENLRKLVNESGLNQTDFGKKVGLDQSVISKLLKKKFKNPTIDTLLSIVGPFKKDLNWIITDHSISLKHPEKLLEAVNKKLSFQNDLIEKFLINEGLLKPTEKLFEEDLESEVVNALYGNIIPSDILEGITKLDEKKRAEVFQFLRGLLEKLGVISESSSQSGAV
jgi:transcriptional regulator with XRE-family HTH domain